MSAVCVHIYRLIKGLSAMVSGSGRIQRQLPANLVHGLSSPCPSILILMSGVRLNTGTVATWRIGVLYFTVVSQVIWLVKIC